jgi:membrane fusion protein (multidrug efflux system)
MMRDKPVSGRNGKRRQTLAFVGLAILAAAACGLYWGLAGRFLESTDNAYVAGNLVQITPQAAGTVAAVRVDDTDLVQPGETLVRLDPAEMEIALERAEAELAQSVRQARHRLDGTTPLPASENTTIEQHPMVRVASASVREAMLALQRTTIRSPVRGYVAKRNVQIGSRVGAGVPLMAIVPLSEVWAEANFKESQLGTLRIGQPVTLSADVYGSAVQYKGTIAGIGAGTGSAFSLLPAQNATGNWIKVVQRLPVRIALDPREVARHPLRVGLSLQVVVDTRDRSGLMLAAAPRGTARSALALPDERAVADADTRIDRIIRANGGVRPAPPTSRMH